VDDYLQSVGTSTLDQPRPVIEVCKRPEVDSADLLRHAGIYDEVVTEAPGMLSAPRLIEIDLKYEGYIERQQDMVEEMEEKERWPIPDDFDYEDLDNVSYEAREKLSKVEPDNLGQASRVPGVRASDISVLMVLLKNEGVEPMSTDRTLETVAGDGFGAEREQAVEVT
jgi:tRNA uridine 5-carboxymethylaminomethyl modification enzyme